MGLVGIEEFSSVSQYIPLFPINHQLANQCYLVFYGQRVSKNSHVSVLIDLVGASTTTVLEGIVIHMTANDDDGNIPHTTSFRFDYRLEQKSQVSVVHVGGLADSQYLHNALAMPNYIINGFVSKLSSTFLLCSFSRFHKISTQSWLIKIHQSL